MSILFNPSFYLAQNPDVLAAVARGETTAAQHFETFGRFEGRNPNAVFNTSFYLLENPDVLEAGVNPLTHFLVFGASEGRVPNASFVAREDFDWETYLLENPDLGEAGIDSLEAAYAHFAIFGFAENRPGVQTNDGGAIINGIPTATAGDTFRLTFGEDVEQGTAGNDVFDARLDANGSQTLQSFDILDGGAGTDTLNATLSFGVTPTTSNIEIVNARAINNVTLNAVNMSDIEQLWSDRSNANLTVTNLQASATLGMNAVAGGTIYNVLYAPGASGGEQALALQGAGTASTAATFSVTDGTTPVTDLTILALAGLNNLVLAGDLPGIENLTISGSANLSLETAGNFAAIQTVDASAYSGDLDLDISGAVVPADLESVVLGSGDNTLTIAGAHFFSAAELTVDLGDGDNTLVLAGVTTDANINDLAFTGDDLSVSGVTTLTFADNINLAADAVLDLDGITPTTIVFEGDLGGGAGLAIENFGSGEAIVFEDEAFISELTVEDSAADFSISFGEQSNIGVLSLPDVVNLTLALGDDDEPVTIGDLDAESLVTLTVTGADDLFLDFGASVEDLTTIDLSGHTGFAFIDVSDADLSAPLTILIGEGDLDYDPAGDTVREVFTFVGEDIGDIDIFAFTPGVGANADRLDFSQFEGISSLDDLDLVWDGFDTEITSDAFDGTITVFGADLTLSEQNFIF